MPRHPGKKPFANVSKRKAKTMLTHGRIRGRRLSTAQKGALGARLGEQRRRKR